MQDTAHLDLRRMELGVAAASEQCLPYFISIDDSGAVTFRKLLNTSFVLDACGALRASGHESKTPFVRQPELERRNRPTTGQFAN